MNFIRQLSPKEHHNLRLYAYDHRQASFLRLAADKPFGYWVELRENDFARIYMNSSPDDPHPISTRFFTLQHTIDRLGTNTSFLDTAVPNGLNGQRIAEWLTNFEDGTASITDRPIFIVDYAPSHPPGPGPYIVDGMHRLVAYGIWERRTFPLSAYYFSNTEATLDLTES